MDIYPNTQGDQKEVNTLPICTIDKTRRSGLFYSVPTAAPAYHKLLPPSTSCS